jgi:hypothetical protein
MTLSIQSGFEHICQLADSEKLTTCGEAAQRVCETLTDNDDDFGEWARGEGCQNLVNELNVPQTAVYLVRLNYAQFPSELHPKKLIGGHSAGWEHLWAFHQVGSDVVLYQAFVNAYSMREWVSGSYSPEKGPEKRYCPAQTLPMATNDLKAWLATLNEFMSEGDWKNGARLGKGLFGGEYKLLSISLANPAVLVWVKWAARAAAPVHQKKCCIIL